jgi:hypothetical protein
MEAAMVDSLRPFFEFIDANFRDQPERPKLSQAQIEALPSVLGDTSLPKGDTTARVDHSGYVYRWKSSGERSGLWVQAGSVRNDANFRDQPERAKLSQAQIQALPSILGDTAPPKGDTAARVDPGGNVYRWEPGGEGGFWVQAGYVRSGRLRFGQPIDPNDIKWFDILTYKKKMLMAKKSVTAIQLDIRDDSWDAASRDGAPTVNPDVDERDVR